jgi:hypothetical protein
LGETTSAKGPDRSVAAQSLKVNRVFTHDAYNRIATGQETPGGGATPVLFNYQSWQIQP